MKNFFCILVVLTVISQYSAGQTIGNLSNGKIIAIRLTSDIYSKHNGKDIVTAIVESDVRDDSNNYVVIRRGTPVAIEATVKKARSVGKAGEIKLNCLNTTAVDGQTIRLMGGYNTEGRDKRGIALGVSLGVGIGTLCLPVLCVMCMKGEDVTIPANTRLHNIVIDDTYRIAVKK